MGPLPGAQPAARGIRYQRRNHSLLLSDSHGSERLGHPGGHPVGLHRQSHFPLPPCLPHRGSVQNESTRRQLAISWGVHPYLSGEVDSTDRMFSLAVDVARKENAVQIGDTVVITAGVPLGQSGTTNLIKARL